MIFAAILAGGSGLRMGNFDKPKQYHLLGKKPILINTIEKFYSHVEIDKIIVLCPDSWLHQTKDMINRYCEQYRDRIDVVPGGVTRNETILKAIDHIETLYVLDESTGLITHDAVRPFVSYGIIKQNISLIQRGITCNTVLPATDTIVESQDGSVITAIPNRNTLYLGQTPQSFFAVKFRESYHRLSTQQKEELTDACKVMILSGEKVELVKGDIFNIKITYPQDMRIAQSLLEDD